MSYKGYKLLDKIMLVCQDKKECEDYYFAYLVDPSNKKQLESARRWGEVINYGRYDPQTRTHPDKKVIPAVEFTFENNGFKFSLLDCAGGSSQGGKLSFWNCIVEKDNNKFKIGINSEMLLSLLRDASFVKGVCTEEVCFVTKSGKVGIAIKDSDLYKEAQADMKIKSDLSKSQTSAYKPGDNVVTLSTDMFYLGTVYRHYKFEDLPCNRPSRYFDIRDVVLTKLKKPELLHILIDTYYLNEGNVLPLDFRTYYLSQHKNKPRKCIGNKVLSDKISVEQFIKCVQKSVTETFDEDGYTYNVKSTRNKKLNAALNQCRDYWFGIGDKDLVLSEELLNTLLSAGVKYIEEE